MISLRITASWIARAIARHQAVIFMPLAVLAAWRLAQIPSVLPDWIAPSGQLRVSNALLGAVAFLAALTLVVEFTHRILEVHGADRYLGYSKNAMLLNSLSTMSVLRSWFFWCALLCTLVMPALLWLVRQLWKDLPAWIEVCTASWWIVCYAFVALGLALGVIGIFRMTVRKPQVLMWKQQDAAIERQIARHFRDELGRRSARAIRRGELRVWVQQADNWAAQAQPQNEARHVVQEVMKRLESSHLLYESAPFWSSLSGLPLRKQKHRIQDLHSYVEYVWRGPDAMIRVDDGREKLGAGLLAATRHAKLLGLARSKFATGTMSWTSAAMSRSHVRDGSPTLDACDATDLAKLIMRQAAATVVRASDDTGTPCGGARSLENIIASSGVIDKELLRKHTAALLLDAIEQAQAQPPQASEFSEGLRADLRRYFRFGGAGSSVVPKTGASDVQEVFWQHLTRDQVNCAPYALELCVTGLNPQRVVLAALFEYLACQRRNSTCACVQRLEVWRSSSTQRWSYDSPSLPTGEEAHEMLRQTAIDYYLPRPFELHELFRALGEPTSGPGLCGPSYGERVPVLSGQHFLLLKVLANEVCSGVSSGASWPFFAEQPSSEFEARRRESDLAEYLTWMSEFLPGSMPRELSRVQAAIEVEQHQMRLFREETSRPAPEARIRTQGSRRRAGLPGPQVRRMIARTQRRRHQ